MPGHLANGRRGGPIRLIAGLAAEISDPGLAISTPSSKGGCGPVGASAQIRAAGMPVGPIGGVSGPLGNHEDRSSPISCIHRAALGDARRAESSVGVVLYPPLAVLVAAWTGAAVDHQRVADRVGQAADVVV